MASGFARSKCPRTWTPATRVQRAMTRISRNRWLPPEEAYRIALALSYRCSGNPHATASAACGSLVQSVGMVRGGPPLWLGDPRYVLLLRAIRSPGFNRNAEFNLLKIMETRI